MLKKLFFYDFSAISRRTLPLLAAILGAGALSFAIVLLGSFLPIEDTYGTLSDLLTALLYLILLAAFVLFFLAELQVFLHYFRSFFSQEGYFTFMIPATREQLFFSKVLSGITWMILIFATATVSITLGILLPFEIVLRAENLSFLSALTRDILDSISPLSVTDLLFSLFAQVITVYTAITMGALFFRKRKLIGAVLFYLLLTVGVFLVRLAFSLIFSAILEENDTVIYLLSLLLSITVSVFGYLITRTLLNTKLNLTQ